MRVEALQFDVVVVGSGEGAFATAIQFARSGVRVVHVTLPAQPIMDFSPAVMVRPAGRSILRKFGLEPHQSTPPSSQISLWTPWGWLSDRLPKSSPGSVLINQRDLLDQFDDLSAQTRNLTIIAASSIEDILTFDGKIGGVRIQREDNGQSFRLLGRLTVAAEGAQARIAQLAQIQTAALSEHPVRYHARYLLPPASKIQCWLLNPNVAVAVPHQDDATEIIYVPAPAHRAAVAKNPERAFARLVVSLPDSGTLSTAQRVSDIYPVRPSDYTRSDQRPGLVFIGNAEPVTNPLWDTTWALQASEQIVDNTLYPLMVTGEIEAGLRLYRRWHQQQAARDQREMVDLATGRRLSRREKLVLAGATRDAALARHVQAYLTCLTDDLFSPDILARATWSNMTSRQVKTIPVTQS